MWTPPLISWVGAGPARGPNSGALDVTVRTDTGGGSMVCVLCGRERKKWSPRECECLPCFMRKERKWMNAIRDAEKEAHEMEVENEAKEVVER